MNNAIRINDQTNLLFSKYWGIFGGYNCDVIDRILNSGLESDPSTRFLFQNSPCIQSWHLLNSARVYLSQICEGASRNRRSLVPGGTLLLKSIALNKSHPNRSFSASSSSSNPLNKVQRLPGRRREERVIESKEKEALFDIAPIEGGSAEGNSSELYDQEFWECDNDRNLQDEPINTPLNGEHISNSNSCGNNYQEIVKEGEWMKEDLRFNLGKYLKRMDEEPSQIDWDTKCYDIYNPEFTESSFGELENQVKVTITSIPKIQPLTPSDSILKFIPLTKCDSLNFLRPCYPDSISNPLSENDRNSGSLISKYVKSSKPNQYSKSKLAIKKKAPRLFLARDDKKEEEKKVARKEKRITKRPSKIQLVSNSHHLATLKGRVEVIPIKRKKDRNLPAKKSRSRKISKKKKSLRLFSNSFGKSLSIFRDTSDVINIARGLTKRSNAQNNRRQKQGVESLRMKRLGVEKLSKTTKNRNSAKYKNVRQTFSGNLHSLRKMEEIHVYDIDTLRSKSKLKRASIKKRETPHKKKQKNGKNRIKQKSSKRHSSVTKIPLALSKDPFLINCLRRLKISSIDKNSRLSLTQRNLRNKDNLKIGVPLE